MCLDLSSTNEAGAPIIGAQGIARNVRGVVTFAHDRLVGLVAALNRKQSLGSLPSGNIRT